METYAHKQIKVILFVSVFFSEKLDGHCDVCIPCILDKNKTTTEKEYHRTRESEACLKHISSRVELNHKTCNEEECVYRTELTTKERKQRRCGGIMAMAMTDMIKI